MDHLEQVRQQVRTSLFAVIVWENTALIGSFWALQYFLNMDSLHALVYSLGISVVLALFIRSTFTNYVLQPLQSVWQLVLHLSPNEHDAPPPSTNRLKLGRELVAVLSAQVFQLINVSTKVADESRRQAHDLHSNFIAQNLPLPLFVMDNSQTILFANEAAARYIGIAAQDMIGKNIYMMLDMSFPSEDTFDSWLKKAKIQNATSVYSWERVRLNVRDTHPVLLFDLAAYYNRDNPDNNETVLVLFDHTKTYSQDDQAISFMALSVHELRTPLTLLRGYIEVFEEELGSNIKPELKDFMLKMHAQSEQLADYVNNILNVARVDDDQMEFKLLSEDWATILKSSIETISLRAKVRGITLKCRISKNLPAVGVDRLGISEVINNLVDNAIKYSGDSKVINVETYLNREGLVETTVQDFGKGIPTSILPNLFTKFYRDHRNRAQIGGTGLGLYLCKAIVAAHGGTIWVRSREGDGSTFGFTLLPYEQLADASKTKDNNGITRGVHGWIKNHSLYRR